MNGKIETLTSVHVVGCVSQSISTDGMSAALVFDIADGEDTRRFMLTFPSMAIETMLGMMQHLAQMKLRAGLPQGALPMKISMDDNGIERIDCAVADQTARLGVSINGVDREVTIERPVIFILSPASARIEYLMTSKMTAMRLCDVIKQTVGPKLTIHERRELSLMQPPAKRIIVPGQS